MWLLLAFFRFLSLDHLIRPEQNRLRNGHTDLFRGFQIDHQLELRRLLDGEIGGFTAFGDLVYIWRGAPVPSPTVLPIEPSSPRVREPVPVRGCRLSVACCEVR